MRTPIFEGVATALVTPMRSDGQIHYKAMGRLVDYQLSHHADGLVVAGTTGEASTLSKEEYEKLLKQVVKQAEGRVPVIAGAGSNCTKSAVETAKRLGNAERTLFYA